MLNAIEVAKIVKALHKLKSQGCRFDSWQLERRQLNFLQSLLVTVGLINV
jgi:hypothetical protein